MKIVKRSQLAIVSVAFMIMIAGYINYKYDPEREKNLGQTVRVNSSDIYLYNNTDLNVYEETINRNESLLDTKQPSSLISSFKSQRDDKYSELEQTYKEVMSNISNDEIIKEYEQKLSALVESKHAASMVENLIKSKGIESVAVIPTEDRITVVVELEEELTGTQVAIIQTIIEEQFGISPDRLTIMQER